MELKDAPAGFTRARRFLFAISLALAITKMLAIPFTKINILGNEADIPHPAQVDWLFWIVWFWALLQYCVWFKDAGAWKEFRAAVDDACGSQLGEAATKKPISDLLKTDLTNNLTNSLANASLHSQIPNIKLYKWFSNVTGDGKEKPRVANISCHAYVRLSDQRGEATSPDTRYEVEITADEWRHRNRIVSLKKFFISRFTFEYFAPFAIALLPVCVAVYRHFRPAD